MRRNETIGLTTPCSPGDTEKASRSRDEHPSSPRQPRDFLLACDNDQPPELYRCRARLSTTQASGRSRLNPMASASSEIDRTIVLVGLMGSGKTCIGRHLARRLELPFVDADEEIVGAAGIPVAEIFATLGESAFREGERKVIARLLGRPPHVLATGGGAFLDPGTRQLIREHGVSIWLRASLDVLDRRTRGRTSRPLLNVGDPRAVLESLMKVRHPVYAEADVVVDTTDEPAEATARNVLTALRRHLTGRRAAAGVVS